MPDSKATESLFRHTHIWGRGGRAIYLDVRISRRKWLCFDVGWSETRGWFIDAGWRLAR